MRSDVFCFIRRITISGLSKLACLPALRMRGTAPRGARLPDWHCRRRLVFCCWCRWWPLHGGDVDGDTPILSGTGWLTCLDCTRFSGEVGEREGQGTDTHTYDNGDTKKRKLYKRNSAVMVRCTLNHSVSSNLAVTVTTSRCTTYITSYSLLY